MMGNGKDGGNHAGSTLVQRVWPDELPGWWSKTLEIRPDQQAVVVRDGKTTVLPPPRHRVAGPGGRGPSDIAIVSTTPFTLHPSVGGLLSADAQLLAADFLVRVQVTDPERAYHALGAGRPSLTVGELAGTVAAEVQGALAAATRRYLAEDLCDTESVAQQLGGDLRGFLATYLPSLGLGVQDVSHLVFLRAEDALRRAEAIRGLRDRLRESDARARLAAARDEKELLDTLRQLEHEYRLRDLLRQEEIDELEADVLGDAPPPKAEPRGDQPAVAPAGRPGLVEWLDRKLASHQEQLVGRFEHLLERLGYREAAAGAASPVMRNLGRWVTGLRALGTVIFLGTTPLTLLSPDLFADARLPQVIAGVGGLAAAVLAFVSAFWLDGRIRARREADRLRMEQARLSPERRQAAEKMVRAQVAGALERIELNLQEAWTRAYRGPDQDAASPLRQLAKNAGALRDEVRAASYQASKLMTKKDISSGDLQAILEVEDGLLRQAQDVAEDSQTLHRCVVDGASGEVDGRAHSLEVGLQGLRNTLIKRDALLKGV